MFSKNADLVTNNSMDPAGKEVRYATSNLTRWISSDEEPRSGSVGQYQRIYHFNAERVYCRMEHRDSMVYREPASMFRIQGL